MKNLVKNKQTGKQKIKSIRQEEKNMPMIKIKSRQKE